MSKEFELDFDGNVGIPVINPIETINDGDRTILIFSIGSINIPKISFTGYSDLSNDYAELITKDGITVRIEFGLHKSATYNWGDPLPARFEVNRLEVNGTDKYYEYIDDFYPWVKYDTASVAYKLYDVYKSEMEKLAE